jgi:hypothetical protein
MNVGRALTLAAALLASSAPPALAQGTKDWVDITSAKELQALYSNETFKGKDFLDRPFIGHYHGLWSVRADGILCIIAQGEICGKIQKNTDGTYTRMVGGAPAFKWLTITPGKDF